MDEDGPVVPDYVLGWAAEHAEHCRRGDERAAADLRDRIAGAGFSLVEGEEGPLVVPAQRYELLEPADAPDRRNEPAAADVSVLLLLQAPGGVGGRAADELRTAVSARGSDDLVRDASRCLAAILAQKGSTSVEIVVCDDGMGGAVADWAADAVRSPGITALHLARSVGTARARMLQQRAAVGAVLLWLEPHVELVGDVFSELQEAFADPAVGLVRLGEDVEDVLAVRRSLVTSGVLDDLEDGAAGRSAAAAVTAAGGRVVQRDLAVVRHGR